MARMKSKDGVVLWLLLINHASDLNGIKVPPKLVPVPASRYLPWPGGVVPYAFVHPAPTSRQMAAVLAAMADIMAATCVVFRPWTPGQTCNQCLMRPLIQLPVDN